VNLPELIEKGQSKVSMSGLFIPFLKRKCKVARMEGACPEIGFLQKRCLNAIIALMSRVLRGVFPESKKQERWMPGSPLRPTAIHLSGVSVPVELTRLPSA
jgi:hypothetical protein